ARVVFDLPVLRIKPAQGDGDFKPGAHGPKARAIRDDDVDAAALLVFEDGGARREAEGYEAHARESAAVEVRGELPAVHPRRAEQLEGGVRPAPDRDVGRLKQADARVERGL